MDDIKTMIQDCEDRESKMSEWETNFIDSVQNQISSGRRLSDKQKSIVIKIWENVTENG